VQSLQYQKFEILVLNFLNKLIYFNSQKRAKFPPVSTPGRIIRLVRLVGALIEQYAYVQ
jgi:hypothetical protein